MSASYAYVNLSTPTPELALEIEAKISLRDLALFSKAAWPGKNLTGLTFPSSIPPRPVRVNSLYWPTGASRFAVGYFLATDNQLKKIRANVYAGGGYAAQPLTLTHTDGKESLVESITTNLWMLPAWPRIQITGSNSVRLLILVDDRYWWQYESTGTITVTENTTTWANLYTLLGSALSVMITPDTINANYLKPSAALSCNYEQTPIVLDAVAYNCGQRIVRRLDGTVLARNVTSSSADAATNAATAQKRAGGKLDLNPLIANDLPGVLPQNVTVTFPQTIGGIAQTAPYVVTATLASLALTDFLNAPTNTGITKTFHDSAVYDGTNAEQLLSLVQQIATDYYRYAVAKYDVKIPGVFPWLAEGWDDSIEWSYRTWDISTRVTRPPFNDRTEELMHAGAAGALTPQCCHPACKTVAIVNRTLSAAVTTNGVTVNAGERILLSAQTVASQNGPWTVAAGAWTRPADYPAGAVLQAGLLVPVELGDVGTNSVWMLVGSSAVTVDTTGTTWVDIDKVALIKATDSFNTGTVWLTAANQSFQVVLGELKDTVDISWSLDYTDSDTLDTTGAPAPLRGKTNGTTVQTMAPGVDNATRYMQHFSCVNTDTIVHTAIFQIDFNGTVVKLIQQVLDVGQGLHFEAGVREWYIFPEQPTAGGDVENEYVNNQTGTTYTVVDSDRGKLISFSNANPVTVTQPRASFPVAVPLFASGWYCGFENRGVGTVTINFQTSKLDTLASSIILTTNHGFRMSSQSGNYYTERGMATATGVFDDPTFTNKVTFNTGPVTFGSPADKTGPITVNWPINLRLGCLNITGQPPADATTGPTLVVLPITAPTITTPGGGDTWTGPGSPTNYYAKYTWVSTVGSQESGPSDESLVFSLTNLGPAPVFTVPALPTGIASWNLYMTGPGASSGDPETLQASGNTLTTFTFPGPVGAGAAITDEANIPVGTSYAKYTWVGDKDAESAASSETSAVITEVGQSVLITVPGLPANTTWNNYWTDAGSGTETLKGSGHAIQAYMYTGFDISSNTFPPGQALPAADVGSKSYGCFNLPDCCGEPTWTGDGGSMMYDRCETTFPQLWIQQTYKTGTNWMSIIGTGAQGDLIYGGTGDGEAEILDVGLDGSFLVVVNQLPTWVLPSGRVDGTLQFLVRDTDNVLKYKASSVCV